MLLIIWSTVFCFWEIRKKISLQYIQHACRCNNIFIYAENRKKVMNQAKWHYYTDVYLHFTFRRAKVLPTQSPDFRLSFHKFLQTTL
jgi:hypothetical protein